MMIMVMMVERRAKLTVQLLNELKTQRAKHGIVTMCVGTGQGAAGVFEML